MNRPINDNSEEYIARSWEDYYLYEYHPARPLYVLSVAQLTDDELLYEYYRCLSYIEIEGWEYDVSSQQRRSDQCWQELELRTRPVNY